MVKAWCGAYLLRASPGTRRSMTKSCFKKCVEAWDLTSRKDGGDQQECRASKSFLYGGGERRRVEDDGFWKDVDARFLILREAADPWELLRCAVKR